MHVEVVRKRGNDGASADRQRRGAWHARAAATAAPEWKDAVPERPQEAEADADDHGYGRFAPRHDRGTTELIAVVTLPPTDGVVRIGGVVAAFRTHRK